MSLTPADYLEVYQAATGQTSAQIAETVEISQGATLTRLTRLTRLEGAGYIRRDADGPYHQAAPFDAPDVTRMITHGWR